MTPVANIYFSGAGLMDVGLEQGGVQIGQSFEIDPDCCRVNHANTGHEVIQMDMRLKLVADEKACDVAVSTFPCNKYCNIADIHNARTGDELYLHFFRHLAIKQPEVYALENVPGMKKFPVVMEAMTKLPGYYVNVFCPISSETWLPQKRERLFVIGSKRNFAWRAPRHARRIRLADILEDRPSVELPRYIYKRLRGKYRDLPIVCDPRRGDIAPTCVAHYSKDLSTRLVTDKRFPHGVRPFSVREYARLQGVPDTFKFDCSSAKAYRMIGNGVSVPAGRWLGREIKRYFN
jgi:DNA (cytosine-5)-methyltransferase 1